jgi:uncharacterized membrane protein (UPF0136 family)
MIGQIVMGVYGVLLIAGGVMGYVKSKSRVSLFAGAIAGGLCVGATWLSLDQPAEGFTIGSLVALLLTGVFINRFAKTRKFMPAGMILVMSAIVGVALMLIQQNLVNAPLE